MTLCIVAISVVFGCLLILFVIYSILGGFFSGMFKCPRKTSEKDAGAASAEEAEVAAAIAAALHMHFDETAHDDESGVITILPRSGSPWSDKSLTFRKNPRQ